MTDLPSPGAYRNGIALQREATAALRRAQSDAENSPESSAANILALRAFFQACAKACPTIKTKDPK